MSLVGNKILGVTSAALIIQLACGCALLRTAPKGAGRAIQLSQSTRDGAAFCMAVSYLRSWAKPLDGLSTFRTSLPVTARVETRFHQRIRVGASLVVTARVIKQRRRLFEVHAEIRIEDSEDTVLAEATAIMLEIGLAPAEAET